MEFSHVGSVLAPEGPIAKAELVVMGNVASLMLITAVAVFSLAIFFAWWYREGNTRAKYLPAWEHGPLSELVWWAVPIEIVLVLGALTWGSTHVLDPAASIALPYEKPLTIQVVALPWRWLFIYPDAHIASVNYVAIPEHVPVAFSITADAPMNSFWIPALGGQIYAMTGMVTKLSLKADHNGTYAGVSANYSGEGFAGMHFTAEAMPQSEYDAWVKTIKKTGAGTLDLATYRALAAPSQEARVHTYRAVAPNLFNSIIGAFTGSANAPTH